MKHALLLLTAFLLGCGSSTEPSDTEEPIPVPIGLYAFRFEVGELAYKGTFDVWGSRPDIIGGDMKLEPPASSVRKYGTYVGPLVQAPWYREAWFGSPSGFRVVLLTLLWVREGGAVRQYDTGRQELVFFVDPAGVVGCVGRQGLNDSGNDAVAGTCSLTPIGTTARY